MWFCPQCSIDIDDSVKNCPKCGLAIPSSHVNNPGNPGNPAAPSAAVTAEAANATANPADTSNGGGIRWNYSGKAFRARAILNWILTFILVGVGIYLMVAGKMGDYQNIIWGVFLAALAIIWVWFFGDYFYKTNFISYRLTEAHLYSEKGLFHRTIDTMELITINDLRMKQTLFDRLINGGVGIVEVHSPSDKTDGVLYMVGMENPQDVLEKIDAARRKLRGRGIVQI